MGKVNLAGNRKLEEMVVTPGGLRPKSNVHLIENGYHVNESDGILKKIHTRTGTIVKYLGKTNTSKTKTREALRQAASKGKQASLSAGIAAPITNQWIIYSGWTNDTSSPITFFSTDWVVPPPPATNNGQLIYLFNGIENSGFNVILQPVLQWGVSPAGGGNYWAIANWYVGSPQSGLACHSSLVPVNTGDTLRGIMTLTGQSGSRFDYNSSFEGYNTDLPVTAIEELVWANETLECYGFKQFSDYPNINGTAMTAIELKTGDTEAVPDWQAFNNVTDNGQNCQIISNSSPNGEVDLNYK